MNSFENKSHRQPHLIIPENVSESQAFISWGEVLLERAQKVAHEIEEVVRRVLEASPCALSCPSPNPTDHNSSNRHAGDE